MNLVSRGKNLKIIERRKKFKKIKKYKKSVDKQKKLAYNKNRPTKLGHKKYIEK